MKAKLLFILMAGLVGLAFLFASFSEYDGLYSTGAPPGYTNSPHDGQNCSHCMKRSGFCCYRVDHFGCAIHRL